MKLRLKRVYEPAMAADGRRILVDRLWPRGLSKEKARLDVWLREIAPTNALRKWFAHDPEKWPGFVQRYEAELAANTTAVAALRSAMRGAKTVTLLFGARDETYNDAVALLAWWRRRS